MCMLLPQYHCFGVRKNNIKGLIYRISFTLKKKRINGPEPIHSSRKQQFLTLSMHDTNNKSYRGLPVRHLEFEKETADHHWYSRLKRLSRRTCTCFTHVLAPAAERLSSETHAEAVNRRNIFGWRDIFGPKFTSRSKLRPKISRR